ncbi:MAG: hypothetical protein LAT57_09000 [Balneolales bacterium]|nr:hypothetical protein [Balneolales bacterium]
MKRILITVTLIFALASTSATAQDYFNGSFNINFWTPDSDNTDNAITLLVSENRLRVTGLGDVTPSNGMMQGLSTDDILIRIDHQDFVIMVSESEALQIKQVEIEAMMNMMKSMSGASQQPGQAQSKQKQSDVTIRETNETRRINGFNTRKLVVTEADSNVEAHVWVSDDFRVNWGMLTKVWSSVSDDSGVASFSEIVSGGQTPLLVEAFEEGDLVMKVELTNLTRGVEASLLNVPTGVELMSFQDMMLKRMRQH